MLEFIIYVVIATWVTCSSVKAAREDERKKCEDEILQLKVLLKMSLKADKE